MNALQTTLAEAWPGFLKQITAEAVQTIWQSANEAATAELATFARAGQDLRDATDIVEGVRHGERAKSEG